MRDVAGMRRTSTLMRFDEHFGEAGSNVPRPSEARRNNRFPSIQTKVNIGAAAAAVSPRRELRPWGCPVAVHGDEILRDHPVVFNASSLMLAL